MEISDIGFIRSAFNCADAFTKEGHCNALEGLLLDGVVDHPVEHWIIRDGFNTLQGTYANVLEKTVCFADETRASVGQAATDTK